MGSIIQTIGRDEEILMTILQEQYLSGLINAEDVLSENIDPEDSFTDKKGFKHYRKYFKSDDAYTAFKKEGTRSYDQKGFLHGLANTNHGHIVNHPDASKPNSAGNTPLHTLAKKGNPEVQKHPDFDKVKNNVGLTPKDVFKKKNEAVAYTKSPEVIARDAVKEKILVRLDALKKHNFDTFMIIIEIIKKMIRESSTYKIETMKFALGLSDEELKAFRRNVYDIWTAIKDKFKSHV